MQVETRYLLLPNLYNAPDWSCVCVLCCETTCSGESCHNRRGAQCLTKSETPAAHRASTRIPISHHNEIIMEYETLHSNPTTQTVHTTLINYSLNSSRKLTRNSSEQKHSPDFKMRRSSTKGQSFNGRNSELTLRPDGAADVHSVAPTNGITWGPVEEVKPSSRWPVTDEVGRLLWR